MPTDKLPSVPPATALVKNILELAVTAVVATVTVPVDKAPDVPTDAFVPVAIDNLFPAVPKTKFPLVAVILPSVAVKVVVEVTDPGAVIELGNANRTCPFDPVVEI